MREFTVTTGSKLDDGLTSNEPTIVGDFVFIASEEPHPIELRRGEVSYIPLRLIYAGEDNNRAETLFGGTCSVTPMLIDIGIKYNIPKFLLYLEE